MIRIGNYNLTYLKHMVCFENLENIILYGLLSHNEAIAKGLLKRDISLEDVQARREAKNVPHKGNSYNIHDLVSFYFNPKNPMLYRRRNIQSEIIIIQISADILNKTAEESQFAFYTDGNAGSDKTLFFQGQKHLDSLDAAIIFGDSWNDPNEEIKKEKRRIRCAEALVYPSVLISQIESIICYDTIMFQKVTNLLKQPLHKAKTLHIQVNISQQFYF